MKFLLSLLLVVQSCMPVYAVERILSADIVEGQDSSKDYLKHKGHFEKNALSATEYNDAAGTVPVDGTGEAVANDANFTCTHTTTTPISGSGSLLISQAASNKQGHGCSIAFTVGTDEKAKVMQIEFSYRAISGTFVAGSSSADSDIIVYIYDVTNSTLIEPSTKKLFSNSASLTDRYVANFQTSSTGTSYRLIFHKATTAAAAFGLQVDNIKVTKSKYVYGTPITDWQSYTPTIPGGAGSISSTLEGRWRRVGDSMEVQFHYLYVSGTGAAADFTLSLPSGYSIDTSKIPNSGNATLGSGYYYSTAAGFLNTDVRSSTSTSIKFTKNAVSSFWQGTDADEAGTVINATAMIPITGWSSSVAMSSDADTRLISFRASRNGSNATLAPNNSFVVVPFNSVSSAFDKDSHSAYSTANYRIYVPTSGRYHFTAVVNILAANTLAGQYLVSIYKNGTTEVMRGDQRTATVGVGPNSYRVSGEVDAVAGDYFDVRFYGAGDNSVNTLTLTGDAQVSFFSGYMLQGPSSIAATETVAARYYSSATDALNNNVSSTINFGTADFDTHGAVTVGVGAWSAAGGGNATSNWKFTCPTSGIYEIRVMLELNSGGGWAANEYFLARLYKSGSGKQYIFPTVYAQAAHTSYVSAQGTTTIRCNAGEYLDVRALQFSGAAVSLDGDQYSNWIEIKRIGL